MLSVPAATDCAPAYGDLDDPWPVFRGILAEHRDWLRSFIAEQTALLAERDPDALTLVFDSNSTEYLEDERFAELERGIASLADKGPLAWVSMEQPRGEDRLPYVVEVREWPGEGVPRRLAEVHYHGAGLRWLA